ncbi:MAG: glycosyltransferase, partial [Pirellulales bacterium]
INGEHYSGAERVQDLLASRLPEFGFDCAFACVCPDKFIERRVSHVPLHVTPMRSRLDTRLARRIAGLVDRHDYRLIHAHTPRTAFIGHLVARETGRPLVYHVHSPAVRESTHAVRNRLRDCVERWSLRWASRLITVSESLRRQMCASGFAEWQVACVPNGVPIVGPIPDRPTPTGRWVIGTVALFRPRKGLEVLLEAVAGLRRRGFDIGFRAIGEFETPDYQRRMEGLASSLGLGDVVEWTGFTSDVNGALSTLDLFVLPSLFGEGLPMVVLEAMAAGVPVVASRVEGVPEAIRPGIDGLLVAPGNVPELGDAVRRLVTGEVGWQRLRQAAHARQIDQFSDRSMANGVARVYRDVLAADRIRPERMAI